MNAPKLSVVIITKNEEKNIAACLDSVKFCDEAVVVDSGSSDRTAALAKERGARVLIRAFDDFASQKNFAMQSAAGEWVLLIDADERVTVELGAEILAELRSPKADGYFLSRRNNIFGRWMRHGANRGDKQLRLVKKSAAFRGAVHERIVPEGRTTTLKHPLLHFSTGSVSQYMDKLNLYTALEVRTISEKRVKTEKPGIGKPLGLFLYRFLFQGGLADGREGAWFSVLSAYYEFVRKAKYWERGQKT